MIARSIAALSAMAGSAWPGLTTVVVDMPGNAVSTSFAVPSSGSMATATSTESQDVSPH